MVDIHHRASLPGARYEVEQGTARRLHGLRWAAAKRYAYWNGTACFPVRLIAGDHGDHRGPLSRSVGRVRLGVAVQETGAVQGQNTPEPARVFVVAHRQGQQIRRASWREKGVQVV